MSRSRFGLRPRLAAWIALIVVLSVGGSYIAIYRGTTSDLRAGIDSDLDTQAKSFIDSLPSNVNSSSLASASRRYIDKQRFEATPRIYVVQVLSGPTVTNEAEVIKKELKKGEAGGIEEHTRQDGEDTSNQGDEESPDTKEPNSIPEPTENRSNDEQDEKKPNEKKENESDDEDKSDEGKSDEDKSSLLDLLKVEEANAKSGNKGILNAPIGFSEVTVEDAGKIRVLSKVIDKNGGKLGTFRVGQPLQPVEQAQTGLRSTFLIVGVVALLMAMLLAYAIATRTSRPLRRMARTAESVSGGDLSHRIDYQGAKDEVGVLAQSFNQMLDRIEQTFLRERAFLSDVSHELRTPLTVIRGQLEVLARQGRPSAEEVDRATKVVTKEVERMDRLVDDLKLLARAEEGSLLKLSTVDCGPYFSELLDSLTLLGEREWKLSEAPRGQLRCDPDRIAQVVRNLARNAVEHTDPGSAITVDVSTVNGTLTISVSDQGPGIETDQLNRIFDRFYRTDSSRSRHSGGAGLGLAIAKALVEAHSGRIWAESTVGEGTTVSFELQGYSGS